MLRMQLMRGTQQSSPLPRDSADKGSMVVESEEISEIGKHAMFSSVHVRSTLIGKKVFPQEKQRGSEMVYG